jgi:hypothetical protein
MFGYHLVEEASAASAAEKRAASEVDPMSNRKTESQAVDVQPPAGESRKSKSRLSQEDVPSYSLEQALRVARAIADNYAFKPTKPVNVAGAMGMTHTAGPFRAISGASIAYGLTTGAAQAPEIGITPLGMRILRPKTVGDDVAAKREALLKPKVVGEFLRDYDGAALPPDTIAKNVLEGKGVPADRLEGVLELIVESAKAVGFIREWGNGRLTVDLAGPVPNSEPVEATEPTASKEQPPMQVHAAAPAAVSFTPGVHINIEIHIAADASSETVEEIFKNMRRYVLSGAHDDDSSTTG